MAAPVARRRMRVFDGFSVLFIVGIAAILTTVWFVVDRAQVTTDELMDRLTTGFQQHLPADLKVIDAGRGPYGELPYAGIYLGAPGFEERWPEGGDDARISYVVYPSADEATQSVREAAVSYDRTILSWDDRPADLCPQPPCSPPVSPTPLAAGVPAHCIDWPDLGDVECVYAVGRVVVTARSFLEWRGTTDRPYLEELSRAALEHLDEAGGAAFR